MGNGFAVNGMNVLKRTMILMLALCLCAGLFFGGARAEQIVELSCGASEWLDLQCTLPDGRLLLTGGKGADGSAAPSAWMLCLNADRTVSWEYIDRDGYRSAGKAAVTEDGTAAVVFEDRQGKLKARFFTADGEPTGRELELPEGCAVYAAEPSRLILFPYKEDGTDETLIVDWDGKELLRYDGLVMYQAYGFRVRGTEELVFVGHDAEEHGRAKIMKMDGLTGSPAWETTLDYILPDTDEAEFWSAVKTEDGGYAAWLQERKPETADEPGAWRDILVKFDGNGRVQWTNREIFETDNLVFQDVFVSGDRIAVHCVPEGDGSPDGFTPRFFRWFSLDGKELDTTVLQLDAEEFSALRQYAAPAEDGGERFLIASIQAPVAMEDGLWALASCYAAEKDGDAMVCADLRSNEIAMVKIPEP